MLTPVDIQQKKFKGGIGYDRKDVNTFFDEVSKSYSELYKSNAELKEKVLTLTDRVQHYKTTEENVQKNLMIAEKTSEEQKANAEKLAKTIELEAKSRAQEIVNQAQQDLLDMQKQYQEIQSLYDQYKGQFAELSRAVFEYLDVHDFDDNPKLDPLNYASSVASSGYGSGSFSAGSSSQSSGNSSSGSNPFEDLGIEFGNDSSLGSGSSKKDDTRSNSSNVYGSTLGGEGIDPFKAMNFGDL